jgi:CheY-like chemotaxis protein
MAILVIEDSRLLRRAIERSLVKAGYDVVAVGDGENGLRVVRETPPDLILLDMMLPTLSGLCLLQQLKQDPFIRHIPVIVLSGLSRKNEAKLAKEGAAGYLEKSDELFRNNSALLLHAVERVLADAANKASTSAGSRHGRFYPGGQTLEREESPSPLSAVASHAKFLGT